MNRMCRESAAVTVRREVMARGYLRDVSEIMAAGDPDEP